MTYEYGIETLEDLTNVCIYHISYNKKAIIQCSVCNKFFVPDKHNGITEKDEIIERNDRKTCRIKLLLESRLYNKIRKGADYD